MTSLVPYAQQERMAHSLVKSGLFGLQTPDQALALMAIAEAEGKHPAIIARDFHIIKGRPSKKAEAMMRDFMLSGGTVKWHALDDRHADATFSHPQGGAVRITWDMDRAAQAGLTGNDSWRKYPRAMLRSRCVSEGVRTVAPLATSGVYTPEEVADMVLDETPAAGPINVTPAPRLVEPEQLADHVRAVTESKDLGELKRAFSTGYAEAKQAGDVGAIEALTAAKDRRKMELEAEDVA